MKALLLISLFSVTFAQAATSFTVQCKGESYQEKVAIELTMKVDAQGLATGKVVASNGEGLIIDHKIERAEDGSFGINGYDQVPYFAFYGKAVEGKSENLVMIEINTLRMQYMGLWMECETSGVSEE